MKTTKGFKAFDKNFTCRGHQFEEGKEFSIQVNPKQISIGYK